MRVFAAPSATSPSPIHNLALRSPPTLHQRVKKSKLRNTLSLDEPAGPDPDGSRIVERIATDSASPLTELERVEAQSLILKAIEHLPPDQRTTLVMVEFHQMQYQDIAEILEVSVSAIKMRVKRARETLRETLKMLQGS